MCTEHMSREPWKKWRPTQAVNSTKKRSRRILQDWQAAPEYGSRYSRSTAGGRAQLQALSTAATELLDRLPALRFQRPCPKALKYSGAPNQKNMRRVPVGWRRPRGQGSSTHFVDEPGQEGYEGTNSYIQDRQLWRLDATALTGYAI